MRRDVARIDLAHAPVRLIIAAPLHTRMKRAGPVVKNAKAARRREGFRTDGTEQYRAWFAKEVGDVRSTGVIGHNGTATRD